MTALILAALLNTAPHSFHLVDAEDAPRSSTQLRLANPDRPSVAATGALLGFGGLLSTAGTAGFGFGAVMILLAGDSVYSGIAYFLGAIIAGVGGVVLSIGIVLLVKGIQKLVELNDANEALPPMQQPERAPAPLVRNAPVNLMTVASF
jgi:hypothetical protein